MKMKNVFILALLLIISFNAEAQSAKKLDKIIKRNYEIIECSIAKMSDKIVEYSLPGETIQISLDASQIARIDFASGRSQTFDAALSAPSVSSASSVPLQNDSESKISDFKISYAPMKINTIAVLPVLYINSDTQESSEDIAKFAQNDLYSRLLDRSANIFPLTVQDLRTTNGLLRKAGIDYKNADEIPIEDLEKILGVDNIVTVKVSYSIDARTSSTTYNSGDIKVSGDHKKVSSSDISTTDSNTEKVYDYTIYFDMYKNSTKIYSQSRKPFFSDKDSWMDSVSYLLKRSPIYVKR